MTPQEESMLNDLIGRVEQTQLTEKDAEAEQLLQQRLARNPDALYILSQTVLVQKYALEQARGQIDQLRQLQQAPPPPQPAHATSFLGSLLGHRDPVPPPPPQPPPPPPGYGPPAYAQQPWSPNPAYGAYGAPPQSGGASSFLRTAATTAAGVAAGALAFQGVESLMHGFGHPGGFGGGGYFGGGAPEETIVNNYYGDDRQSGRDGEGYSGLGDSGKDASSLQQASDDLRAGSDGTDDKDDLQDASYDDSSADDSSYDDSSSNSDFS
jgi:uncharacterized protein